ncbi:MAG TPA: PAS-domain containing protein, partial [Inquilinus sp.]
MAPDNPAADPHHRAASYQLHVAPRGFWYRLYRAMPTGRWKSGFGRVRKDGTSVTAASRSGEPPPSRPVLDPVLDAVAAILGAGICLLDAEDRVLAWNDTYLELFPEEADLLRPGLP